ncbi:MAG: hypothetical protein QOG16_782 [Actinomycetota bacterium]|jgi:uncharacterized protein YbbK (DUF523 family)|nr:hypothetical protein [Actinomycetota bacterium]
MEITPEVMRTGFAGPVAKPVSEVPTRGLVRPELVLVSACLAGCACRYDGAANKASGVARLVAEGRAIQVCPEQDGGLPTPRPPAEIVGGDGHDVLAGRARVLTRDGDDVTEMYVAGARRALEAALASGATKAILKSRSPSCGKGVIYDGSFGHATTEGDGVTTALLTQNGIEVVTEKDI